MAAMATFALSILWVQAEVTVSNLAVAQRPGTKLVDITYDVSSMGANIVTVFLVVSSGTSEVSATSVTGDVGANVATGTGRMILWDAGTDWNGNAAVLAYTVVAIDAAAVVPKDGMVVIPAGINSGTDPDFGYYSLTNAIPFCMDKYEVTNAQWNVVYNWAVANGYSFDHAGSGKGTGHPVHTVSWYDCVKWCNARSERDGRTPCYAVSGSVYRSGQSSPSCNFSANGYRLPTSDEWGYAARGGLKGKRFPWGDTITHAQANYHSHSSYSYDISHTRGYHPDYDDGGTPYTSPAGFFAANGYGLYDMAGNMSEWCNDALSYLRYLRGGSWGSLAPYLGCGFIDWANPDTTSHNSIGFRSVCR